MNERISFGLFNVRTNTHDIHVLPINDLREHQERRECWCLPRVDATSETAVITHHAADGRELVERHGLQ